MADPTPPQARHRQALRLRLPAQEGVARRHGQDQGVVLAGHEPAARGSAAPTHLDAAGLDRLLPLRLRQYDLRICEGVPVATGLWMVAPQAPENDLEETPSPIHPRRMVARRRGGGLVQPGKREHQTLLLPGNEDPPTVADRHVRETSHPTGLVESRM